MTIWLNLFTFISNIETMTFVANTKQCRINNDIGSRSIRTYDVIIQWKALLQNICILELLQMPTQYITWKMYFLSKQLHGLIKINLIKWKIEIN